MFNESLLSSKSDHWSTPAATYDALNEEFGFTFDPCPLGRMITTLEEWWIAAYVWGTCMYLLWLWIFYTIHKK